MTKQKWFQKIFFLFLFSYFAFSQNQSDPKILKHTRPAVEKIVKLNSMPALKKGRFPESIDLCGKDLRTLDLRGEVDKLYFADFDSRTIWPKSLPPGFNPETIMEKGKNPGLGLKKLHNMGITGKGIGVALIDWSLLTGHQEYRDQLRFYDEINWPDDLADMHGTAAASIVVGKACGVAPGANLFHFGVGYWNKKEGFDFSYVARALAKILQINQQLPDKEKIRVIAMQSGWNKNMKGGEELASAIIKVKRYGIFFISSCLIEDYGFFFQGLDREPLENPVMPGSYRPGLFWAEKFYIQYDEFRQAWQKRPHILIPMDARTTAAPTGTKDYVFYRVGGWSWVTPFLAGLYALACQVRPDVTPEIFWKTAFQTGDTINFKKNGREFQLEKIVNPEKLILALKQP